MAHVFADRVLETSTTTGTGAMSLAGAVAGHVRFGAKLSVNDTCHYMIQAVDPVGRPTGEWELGRGTYSATDVLTRTTIIASSNAGSAVSFSAGTKQVALCIAAPTTATLQADWRTAIGMGNVDNTSDANKPVSSATQAALDLKATQSDMTAAQAAIALKANLATSVQKTSDTGAAKLPHGTTAQRPTPDVGNMRFNDETGRYEGANGTSWGSMGGATGGGNDAAFYLNSNLITQPFTVPAGQNAGSFGPMTIADGVAVTVAPGATWTIV